MALRFLKLTLDFNSFHLPPSSSALRPHPRDNHLPPTRANDKRARRVGARVFKHTDLAGRANNRPNWSFQTSQLVISYNMDNIHNHEVDAYVYIDHYITRSNSNLLKPF